ncbi:ORF17 [Ranid herpesvirus 1]|uniref:ORF17 n=1 Tax=Ranid herpesvirus 1 TaxID=85655 RepID=Q14VU1_9VIRU|nr:ORF17 [Ranid herpesvirus 1]ABG25766.1 ORF17 [Ranid herpesvirus 1]
MPPILVARLCSCTLVYIASAWAALPPVRYLHPTQKILLHGGCRWPNGSALGPGNHQVQAGKLYRCGAEVWARIHESFVPERAVVTLQNLTREVLHLRVPHGGSYIICDEPPRSTWRGGILRMQMGHPQQPLPVRCTASDDNGAVSHHALVPPIPVTRIELCISAIEGRFLCHCNAPLLRLYWSSPRGTTMERGWLAENDIVESGTYVCRVVGQWGELASLLYVPPSKPSTLSVIMRCCTIAHVLLIVVALCMLCFRVFPCHKPHTGNTSWREP